MHQRGTYKRLWGGIFAAFLATVFAFMPGIALATDYAVSSAVDLANKLASTAPDDQDNTITLGRSSDWNSMTGTINVAGKHTLNLNGYMLTCHSDTQPLYVQSGATLTVVDTAGDGGISSLHASAPIGVAAKSGRNAAGKVIFKGGSYQYMGQSFVEANCAKGYTTVFGMRYGDTVTVCTTKESNGVTFVLEDCYTPTATDEMSASTLASGVANTSKALDEQLSGVFGTDVAYAVQGIYTLGLTNGAGAVDADYGLIQVSFPYTTTVTDDNWAIVRLAKGQGASIVSGVYDSAKKTISCAINWDLSCSDFLLVQTGGHTITFNANGGTGTMPTQVVLKSTDTKLNKNAFTRTGCSFVNWNTAADGSGTTYADEATVSLATDLKLYAQWTATNAFFVKFDGNGATSGSMSDQAIIRGESTALTANAYKKTGYVFFQWNTKADGTGTSYADAAKVKNLASAGTSITLYAQWTGGYTVKFNGNGGTGSMPDQEIATGVATRLKPNKFARSGYAFSGWNTQADGKGITYSDYQEVRNLADANKSVTLYAQWSTTMPMYRLYNPNSGEHFYTGSEAERVMVAEAGWNYEGVGWNSPATSSAPIYRLYNPNGGDHHYTMSAGERDLLIKEGWSYEGTSWYSDTARTVPIYRAYNPNATTGAHNFTADANEQAYIVSVGWNDEGIAWYGVK